MVISFPLWSRGTRIAAPGGLPAWTWENRHLLLRSSRRWSLPADAHANASFMEMTTKSAMNHLAVPKPWRPAAMKPTAERRAWIANEGGAPKIA